jgi:hypothetical protein
MDTMRTLDNELLIPSLKEAPFLLTKEEWLRHLRYELEQQRKRLTAPDLPENLDWRTNNEDANPRSLELSRPMNLKAIDSRIVKVLRGFRIELPFPLAIAICYHMHTCMVEIGGKMSAKPCKDAAQAFPALHIPLSTFDALQTAGEARWQWTRQALAAVDALPLRTPGMRHVQHSADTFRSETRDLGDLTFQLELSTGFVQHSMAKFQSIDDTERQATWGALETLRTKYHLPHLAQLPEGGIPPHPVVQLWGLKQVLHATASPAQLKAFLLQTAKARSGGSEHTLTWSSRFYRLEDRTAVAPQQLPTGQAQSSSLA